MLCLFYLLVYLLMRCERCVCVFVCVCVCVCVFVAVCVCVSIIKWVEYLKSYHMKISVLSFIFHLF